MTDPIPEIARLLTDRGYRSEVPPLGATLLMVRKGRSLGPFFPFVDFLFVREVDPMTFSADELERLHGDEIAFAEKRFRLPRALRYRIPNVVTIVVSSTPPSEPLLAAVTRSRLRSQYVGGLKDSVFLLDVAERRLHSAGVERTPTGHGGTAAMGVDPTNRVHDLMQGLARAVFALV